MEPSLSYDASIVLRTSQDEVRYGARVVFDAGTGALRSDHIDAPPPEIQPLASLRAVSGRWLFDASAEGRVSINGVTVGGARIISAGDVLTIAGSQLLVEEATQSTLALRRFDLVGNDTLPPVGDSVRVLAPSVEDLPIDLGELPEHRRLRAAAGANGRRPASGTTPPGSWAACWRWCSACSRCSSPSRSICNPPTPR